MKFIDFFAGIGGIRLGLEQSGHVCVGFCEFDKFARQSYKAIHNTEGEWENHDIRTVKPYELPEADLWTFGFPCQDLSIAGKQKGLQAGERSGLFYEIMRLLAGRRQEDRPQWLLVENVKNLLSIGNGFDFARLLCEVGGNGYSLQWDTLNSKNFGVPQNRERVFIVGCLGNISGREVFPLRGADEQNPCKLQELTSGQAQALRCYDPVGGVSRCLNSGAGGMGAKTGLYVINACEDGRKNIKTLKANYSKVSAANFISDTGYGATGVCEVKEKLVPIKVSKPYGTERKDTCPTLRAQSHGNEPKVIEGNVRIRKLTPKECWRLQGFLDEYFDKAKAAGVSDSQLYKQAGNAVTVNVARAIGEKLKEIEEKSR